MWRGLIIGVISGGGLAGLVFLAAAIVLPPVSIVSPEPSEAFDEAPADSNLAAMPSETPSVETRDDVPVSASVSVLAEAPPPSAPGVDTSPTPVPETDVTDVALDALNADETPSSVGAGADLIVTPVETTNAVAEPSTPALPSSSGLDVDTDSAGVPTAGGANVVLDAPTLDQTETVAGLVQSELETAATGVAETSVPSIETTRVELPISDELEIDTGSVAQPVTTPREPVIKSLDEGQSSDELNTLVVANERLAPETGLNTRPPDLGETDELVPDLAPEAVARPEVAVASLAPVTPRDEPLPRTPALDSSLQSEEVAALARPVAPAGEVALPDRETPNAIEGSSRIAPGQNASVEPSTPRPAAPPLTFDPPRLPGSSATPLPRVPEPTAPPQPEELPAATASTENVGDIVEPTGPAVVAFSVPFTPTSDRPRLGIVLVDTPSAYALLPEDLSLPFAVAVDPLAPGATERMSELKEIGAEILVLAPLPAGGTPSDVEVAFEAFVAAVPQAIGVMDLPAALMQENRARAEQVVEIVKSSGHGLLTYQRGFNSLVRVAQTAGVPALSVARVFDTGDSSLLTMKRKLDQGAFDTSRDGRAILVGTLRPETLLMLAAWSNGSRADGVEIAPVSAVLLNQ